MMKKWITYISSLFLVASLGSCQKATDYNPQGEGELALSLTTSDATIAGTKSDDQTTSYIFSVDIVNSATGDTVAQYADHTQLTTVNLAATNYIVGAATGDKEVAQFDIPSYYGSTETTVVAGETVQAQVEAFITNVVFTTSFDETINNNFTQADLLIYNQEKNKHLFTISKDNQDRLAYLPVQTGYYWVLMLTNTQGSQYMLSGEITDAEERNRYDFEFEISSDSGEGDGIQIFDVTIDKNLEEFQHLIMVSTELESAAPQISSDDVDVDQTIYVNSEARGVSAKFDIESEATISSLWFYHESSVLFNAGIPYAVNLVSADAAMRATFSAVGITYSTEIENQSEAYIDYTDFCNTIEVGTYNTRFAVTDKLSQFAIQTVVVDILPDQDHLINSVTSEALYAQVQAQWITVDEPTNLTLEYKIATESDWQSLDPDLLIKDQDNKTFEATLYNLEPSTKYEIRSVSDEYESASIITFTTKEKVDIYNIDFQTWSYSSSVWYPNSSATCTGSFWCTGNEGTANTFAAGYSITYPDSDATYGTVVKMESIYISAILSSYSTFAAGSIYTGYYSTNISDPIKSAKMGRPYAGRPVGLKGRYKYNSEVINRNDGGSSYDQYKGQDDQGNIYIKLEDWGDSTIEPEDFGSDNVPSGVTKILVGYGNEVIDDTDGEWVEFYMPIDYESGDVPTHITFVATSSIYGDNFCGAEGSILWVSGFELIWSPLDIPEL